MNTQRSEAQIAASRANGALSRGPVTEEGKARSAQSNVRHGLLSNTVLVVGESAEIFDRLLASQIEEFDPQTESEMLMVEEMVVCKWRQIRLWGITSVGLNDEIVDQREKAPELVNRPMPSRAYRAMHDLHKGSTTMSSLQRYERSFSRQYDRLLGKLTALKQKRQASGPKL
jgi:hypothetical protein